jgi:hypothetical protein
MPQRIGSKIAVNNFQARMELPLNFDNLTAEDPADRRGAENTGINVEEFHSGMVRLPVGVYV